MIPTPENKTQKRMYARLDESPSGCWLWRNPSRNGYGYIWVTEQRRSQPAHRFSYETFVGAIPAGMQIDHLCRVRNCVNPRHLEAVTGRENILRGVSPPAQNARVTHCRKGHPYDISNTYTSKRGMRYCRACAREKARARGYREVMNPRSECSLGHSLSGLNLYVKPNGQRACVICKRDGLRRWRAARKVEELE